MEGIEFEKSINFGDILSSVTILLSAVGLFISIDANTKIQTQRLAEERREAAAQVIVASDQWIEADRSIIEKLQPIFVEASRMASVNRNPTLARDFYWKNINEIKAQISSSITEKELSTTYQKIMIYDPSSRSRYRSMVESMRESERLLIEKMLLEGQDILLESENSKIAEPAIIGNDLRKMSFFAFQEFLKNSDEKIRQERMHFCAMIYGKIRLASECAKI